MIATTMIDTTMIDTTMIDTDMIETELLDALKTHTNILCISHVSPDGDAVGSLLGMGWLLRHMGKEPTLALQDPVPPELRALPGAEKILVARPAPESSAPANPEGNPDVVFPDNDAKNDGQNRGKNSIKELVQKRAFDLVICLDASSPDRMGVVYNPEVHGTSPLVVIDHHITNTFFGDINWVAPICAATCQMLLYLADALAVPLDAPLAECLLTGLVTDTLCFRTSNTDAQVLEAAMRLVQGGANLAEITERSMNRRSMGLINLWKIVLPRVELGEGVIWTSVRHEDFATAGYPPGDVGLSSFLVTADEADISAVFTEKTSDAGQPAVECSFRAKPGFDVSAFARSLGGGGHPAASGCTVAGTLAEVTAELVPALQKIRREQARSANDHPIERDAGAERV